MGDRYGRLIWEIGHQCDIDRDTDMGYVLSVWDIKHHYGYLPYRYGPSWISISGDEANDMGDDSIDTVISHIDMGYLVTLPRCPSAPLSTNTAQRHPVCTPHSPLHVSHPHWPSIHVSRPYLSLIHVSRPHWLPLHVSRPHWPTTV